MSEVELDVEFEYCLFDKYNYTINMARKQWMKKIIQVQSETKAKLHTYHYR